MPEGREVQTRQASEPEGRLLAYYSATMVYSPLGASGARRRWSVGVEGTWLPPLSESRRRPGIDKPETTNLSPILPRPRLTLATPLALLEASWVPPVTVADARANLLAVAISRSLITWRGATFSPRLSFVRGRVQGAITCNAGTAVKGGADIATYYAAVCHGRDSDDWFEPRIASGELVAIRPLSRAGAQVVFSGGARVDRSRFDIGVIRADGVRDPDHPVLRLRDTRPHMSAGITWPLAGRVTGAAEWFYAPGSVTTVRALLSIGGQGVQ